MPKAIRPNDGVALLLVLAGVLAAGCTHSTKSHPAPAPSTSTSSTTTTSATTPTLTTQRAQDLSDELSRGDDESLLGALAVPSGQAIDPQAAGELAAIGPITFDVSTFQAVDASHATVQGALAHPPTGSSATWTFALTYVSGTWKLNDAEPAS